MKTIDEFHIDVKDLTPEKILPLMKKNGFVLIKNFLTKKEIQPVWNDLRILADAFYDGCGIPLEKIEPEESDKYFVKILSKRPDIQSELYDRMQMMPSLLSIPSMEKCRNVGTMLLETERVGVWPRMQMRMDIHKDEHNTIGWHTDYIYNKGTKSSYTFWMPMVNMNKDMGLPRIAIGSHNMDIELVETTGKRYNYTLSESTLSKLNIYDFEEINAGDLLLFHSMSIHTGNVNHISSRARLTSLFRIQNLNNLEVFRS